MANPQTTFFTQEGKYGMGPFKKMESRVHNFLVILFDSDDYNFVGSELVKF